MIQTAKQADAFVTYPLHSIRQVARSDPLPVITSLFNKQGFPDGEQVEAFLTWDIWWQGEGENRTLDRTLLRSFSSMFSGMGLPDKESIDDYLAWDIWWQGEGEGEQDPGPGAAANLLVDV